MAKKKIQDKYRIVTTTKKVWELRDGDKVVTSYLGCLSIENVVVKKRLFCKILC